MRTINVKGKIKIFTKPCVMGILNITPDSFYSGSRFTSIQAIVDNAGKMIEDGAEILDIGGMSSRPDATEITSMQEAERVIPAISAIHSHFPDTIISVDTYRSDIARQAVEQGASIVNDITAGLGDDTMLATVATLGVPFIMMHMRGNPRTMQQSTAYDDIVRDILIFFADRIKIAKATGITDIIIDPGFGFGKSLNGNYTLLNHLASFRIFDYPVLAGLSRKSMIYKALETDAEHALEGTIALNMSALERGADIIRVHDVAAAVDTIRLHELLKNNR